LLELRKIGQDDFSIVEQAQLAHSNYAKDALKAGLITDKNIMKFIESKH
jgi:hypothetical protein